MIKTAVMVRVTTTSAPARVAGAETTVPTRNSNQSSNDQEVVQIKTAVMVRVSTPIAAARMAGVEKTVPIN